MSTSSTVENYLKTIYLGVAALSAQDQRLPMGQLASALGVAPGTATTMVKALAESGLVNYEPYAGVTLTTAGETLAALVLRRHRLVELFLVRVLGYSWDEVHDEAEHLEHAVSDLLIERIDRMLGHPEVDPHGDPIPDVHGQVKRQDTQTLLTCPLDTPAVVARVLDQDRAFLRFIEQHDLKPGMPIQVEARDDASDSVRVRAGDRRVVTIGTRAASKLLVQVIAVLLLLAGTTTAARAQTTATVSGRVVDAQGGLLPGASVRLTNAVTGFDSEDVTAANGGFRIANVPPRQYRLTVTFDGFEPATRDIEVQPGIPVHVDVSLALAARSDSLTVRASDQAGLVDPTLTGTRTAVSRTLLDRMPAATGSRGIESVLVSFPGFAQNANGAIHPRGAHNQMTYVVDGLAISDQLTGAFANALDTGMVQNVELMTGNIPAEFGAKISGVAVVTTRSGLGVTREATGEASVRAGQFGTAEGAAHVGGQRGGIGYFATLTAMRTARFLDAVSLDNLHNAGQFGRAFARVDAPIGAADLLRVHAMGGRSTFELSNLRSQEASGQDQRQDLADWSAWLSHVRTLGRAATLESTAAFRTTTARLLPSEGDIPVTASQDRRLTSMTFSTRHTRMSGRHSLRAGADLQRFPVRERFALGLTRSDFNDPAATDFNRALLPYDLTRGGSRFEFQETRTGTLVSAFAQDQVTWPRLTATLGLRFDEYRFIVRGRQIQPRIGLAWSFPSTRTVLRGSYNRNYQTPPNENLLLSSSETASRLAPQRVRDALGGTYAPMQPERQDVVEVGVQQALFGRVSLDVSAYHKYSRDQQDNNNFFETGVIFPTTLKALRATGLEMRATVPEVRGLSGSVSFTTARAVSTPPFTGGLFLGQDAVDLLSAGPFVIDHDQVLSAHGTANYAAPAGVWFGASVRYDSGLVANPSDPAVVASDPDFADLLPYVDLASEVPRVRPRTIADVVVGYDARRDGRRLWGARVQVHNLTNRTALFNFQSVFVGTRVVQPRTASATLHWYW